MIGYILLDMHICLFLYRTILSLLHTLLQHINIFFLYAFPGYSVWHRRPHYMEKANATTGKGHSFGSFHKEGITVLSVNEYTPFEKYHFKQYLNEQKTISKTLNIYKFNITSVKLIT